MLFYALVYSMDSGKLSENKDAERRLLFIYLYLSFSTNFQVSDVQSFFEMFGPAATQINQPTLSTMT